MYDVKRLVKDSIVVALMSLYLIIINFTGIIYNTVSVFIVTVSIGLYYKDKKITRGLLGSFAVTIISFIYCGLMTVITFVFPSVLLGFLSIIMLRMNNKYIKYSSLFVVYYVIEVIIELLYAKLIVNLNVVDYILAGGGFEEVSSIINNSVTVFVIIYFIVLFIISFMKVIILINCSKIYENRLKKFIDGKID